MTPEEELKLTNDAIARLLKGEQPREVEISGAGSKRKTAFHDLDLSSLQKRKQQLEALVSRRRCGIGSHVRFGTTRESNTDWHYR